MATTMSAITALVRRRLNEVGSSPTTSFWTDADLLALQNLGVKDLWRAINDLYKHYFVTIDDENVTLPAYASSLDSVPCDCFRVVSIEPRLLGPSNPNRSVIFKPRDWNHPDMVQARARGSVSPDNTIIYYDVMYTGAPVEAPVIRVAPPVSSPMSLTLVYNHVLADRTASQHNPIPGESDNAIVAWTVAYAKGDNNEQQAPDLSWLAVYNTEKTNLLKQLTPRQIQEPEVVEGMWEDGEYL